MNAFRVKNDKKSNGNISTRLSYQCNECENKTRREQYKNKTDHLNKNELKV